MTRHKQQTGFTLIELMIVVAIIAIIAAIAIPGLLRAKLTANEASTLGSLRTLAIAEEEFRQGAAVDQDGDGQGEYAYLQEMAGTVTPRGASATINPAFISQVFGYSATASGVADKSGYHYLVFLPTTTGTEAEQSGGSFNVAAQANANAQELRFICYAWPVSYSSTGVRAFAITQKGEVFATRNDSKKYSSTTTSPTAAAALDSTGSDPSSLQSTLGGAAAVTGDGQTWTNAGG